MCLLCRNTKNALASGTVNAREKGTQKMGRDGKIWQDKLNQCFHKIICKADGTYQLNQIL